MSPPDARVADYCMPLTGYRAWSVTEAGLLMGCSHQAPWPPHAAMQAQCHTATYFNGFGGYGTPHMDADEHWIPAPAPHCGCGIYAYKSDEELDECRQPSSYLGGHDVRVWGTVHLWGRVIEHEDGFRAEYAYPAALHTNDPHMSARLATLYGVKVTCIPDEPTPDADEPEDEPSFIGGLYAATMGQTPTVNIGSQVAQAWQHSLLTYKGQTIFYSPMTSFASVGGGFAGGIVSTAVVSHLDPRMGEPVSIVWHPEPADLALLDRPCADLEWVQLFREIARGACA